MCVGPCLVAPLAVPANDGGLSRRRGLPCGRGRGLPWQVVTGPAAATVVTAYRLGWDFRSPAVLVTHDGTVLDCRLDPPAAIENHVCEAVRRWRLARICAAFPQILPAVPDLVHAAAAVEWPELGANGRGAQPCA